MVEADLDPNIPGGLLVAFSIITTLVVTIHLMALMISTCILPNLEAVSNVHNVTAVLESPHDKMHKYIEMSWIFSTGIGILLFLIQVAILSWLRFHNVYSQPGKDQKTPVAPIASTAIIVPSIVIFVAFAVHFYRQLIAHKYERSTRGLEELENMALQLDAARMGTLQTV